VARPDWALRKGIVSLAGQPLVFRGEILGVLAIANTRAFDEIARLRRQLEVERDYLREEVKEALAFGKIVGASAALRGVLEQVEMVAPTDATALILGESGTGKELIAAANHERSARRERPFVRVNFCPF
jgi:transcriptional regulator with GAF, ATPase, and Fis domain